MKIKINPKISFLPDSIEEKINNAVTETVKDLYDIDIDAVRIEYPELIEHGDFSTNVAMQIVKQVKKSSREIGEEIKNAIKKLPEIEKIEIAGPGFLNFFVKRTYLTDELKRIDDTIGENIISDPKTIITDISHPNAAKPMGTHHLLSTIIGDAVNNLLSFIGHNITRDSYWGDWGTQFGKLVYAYKNWGKEETVKKDPINELLKLYVEFHNRAEEDKELDQKARDEFKKLEDGDKETQKIWQWIIDLSKEEFFRLYKRLNIKFDTYYGESFYFPVIPEVIDEGKEKKIFVTGEKGALVAIFDDEQIPTCPVVKSDGATLYHTRDIARIKYWIREKNPDLMIYVVDAAQSLHFIQLFEMARKFNWSDIIFKHASFGRMRFKDKKMSTRKGNIILMKEVLDEAEKRALKLIEEKGSELSDIKKENLSKIMGIGAIKYNILSQNRITDIVFDWDKMLTFEGNSAPYIQYTHARARSILRKAEDQKILYKKESIKDTQVDQKEKELILLISRFPKILIRSAEEYYPHLICNYLYDLCQKFNSFYNSEPVLNAKEEDKKILRLRIVETVTYVIQNSTKILGIRVPEKM